MCVFHTILCGLNGYTELYDIRVIHANEKSSILKNQEIFHIFQIFIILLFLKIDDFLFANSMIV
jgi:hypothetical protein